MNAPKMPKSCFHLAFSEKQASCEVFCIPFNCSILRISNFLLYQLAYAELYFTNVRWPDFRKNNLYEAILDYQGRERRFGKTGEQIAEDVEVKKVK